MSWLADNSNAICILLAIVAAGLVVYWRFDPRVKFLYFAGGVLIFLAAFWSVTRFIPTDARDLERDVKAMAGAVEAANVDELFKHISKDFNYHGMKRDEMYRLVRRGIDFNRVNGINISSFRMDKPPADGKATTSFLVTGNAAETLFMYRVETDFTREGNHWKLRTMRFYNPRVNQDQEIRLPGL